MDSKKKRVRILLRVSSDMQLNSDADIPVQRNACLEFIRRHENWELDNEYIEKAVSGFKNTLAERDVLQSIKTAALKQEFEILLVFMFDRLGRIQSETPFIVKWFTEQGVEVWSVKEGQQKFENHVDDLLNFIRFWQADGESQKISIRVDEAMKQMAAQGKYYGGRPSYGYQTVPTGNLTKKKLPENKLAVLESEAAIVRLIFDLALRQCMGSHKIARYLNEHNITSRTGTQWNHCTIAYILRNPIYKGYMVYGRTTQKGHSKKQHRVAEDHWVLADEPNPEIVIIPEEIWEQVQKNKNMLVAIQEEQHQINLETPCRINRSKLLLIGLIKCGHCGSALVTGYTTARWITADGVHHRVNKPNYTCGGQSSGKIGCDGKHRYAQEKIEGVVLEEVYQYLDTLKNIELSDEIARLQKQNTQMEEKSIRELQKSKRETEKALQGLKAEVIKVVTGKSDFDKEMLTNMITDQENELANINDKLAGARIILEKKKLDQADLIQLQSLIPVWREEFQRAPVDMQKVLISKIIKEVIVYADRIEILLRMKIEDFLKKGENSSPTGGDFVTGVPALLGPDRYRQGGKQPDPHGHYVRGGQHR